MTLRDTRRRLRLPVAYLATLALAVAAFVLFRHVGEGLVAPGPVKPGFGSGPASAPDDTLPHLLLALTVIILLARGLGLLFKRWHQPPVVGEVLAGLMLGPSLLGRAWPGASAFLLPDAVAPFLGVLAQVGIILYMFLVGLELDPRLLRRRTQAAVAISHASILAPFLLGSGLALFLYPRLSTSDVPFTVFALFLGVAMSITAFPVLARILTDRGLARTRLGALALTCAAVDDVTAWCLLALVVSVARAQASGAVLTVVLTALFIAGMLVVARPLLERLAAKTANEPLTRSALALTFAGLLVAALATEVIGIHALFGAFFFGAVIPSDSRLARELTARLEDIVVVFFLPAFFAFTGLRTRLGLVSGAGDWLVCGLIIVAASAGKFGGTLAAAKATGLSTRDGAALGILMNTRGLMELVVLNIGLDLGVITPTLFAMMVLMALVTTFATTPVLHLLMRHGTDEADLSSDRRPARG